MRTGKLAKRTSLILLTVSSLSCQTFKSADDFPAKYYYEVDLKNKFCGRWEILNGKTVNAFNDNNMPMSECDGVIGFKYDEFAKVQRWIRRQTGVE